MSTSPKICIQFDPVREVCRNQSLNTDDPYTCVFAHGQYLCANVIRDSCKLEAMHLATKLQSQQIGDISWADLWRFVTDVHCVHHFDEAVNFELPYCLEILVAMQQEEVLRQNKQKRLEEWEAELRRGEEKEEVRRSFKRKAARYD